MWKCEDGDGEDEIVATRSGAKCTRSNPFRGEMNPLQLRETTMAPETRRLVQLTMDSEADTRHLLDLLLAKKRATDRRGWLEEKGALAEV